ncbi:efflux RND transporter periplasmic adaptor subunit [Thermomonas flagellata]|uniref:efflux RND transporter periplasmic adaptor subunit n=1 Tax=Thermomonas flagellata TaxID=2888524 RepID=UPI001F050426|nr:efflux RND transporter periplasmic adaptor subunit [Thermomonas flagellata]
MQGPQAVTASLAQVQPMPVWLTALGTVTPHRLVNVMPRVSGLLESVEYRQGQQVRQGQLLARIDPRPFEVAVQQAQAQVAQTQAQLAGAQRDLARYETLLKQDSIAEQQVADQRTTVAQLQATLKANQAALANAQLQLGWTRITAPVDGIVGLRPVDAGNLVNTSGAVGGGNGATSGTGTATPVAVIAQVQPVQVTFALPQPQVADVLEELHAGHAVTVQAWDAGNSRLLDSGRLLAADNQINAATGTLAFRAEFPNRDLALYPNAFVNVRVLVRTIPDALMVPTTAVAVGAPGTYVYVIGANGKVALRRVVTGGTHGDLTRITQGLRAGERVVTDGLDRLRDGAQVKVVPAQSGSAAPAAGGHPSGKRHGAG